MAILRYFVETLQTRCKIQKKMEDIQFCDFKRRMPKLQVFFYGNLARVRLRALPSVHTQIFIPGQSQYFVI